MGTKINPPPIESGTDCNLCTPALWPVGETPKFMYVYFEGILDCGRSSNTPPNGQTFKLEQYLPIVCTWINYGAIWQIDFIADRSVPNQSRLRLADQFGWSFFVGFGLPCPPEFTLYANAQAVCMLMYAGAAGTALLTWHYELVAIINYFGLELGLDIMHEIFNHPDGDIAHKICSLYYRTNVKFKIEL